MQKDEHIDIILQLEIEKKIAKAQYMYNLYKEKTVTLLNILGEEFQVTQFLISICYIYEKMLKYINAFTGYPKIINILFDVITNIDEVFNEYTNIEGSSKRKNFSFISRLKVRLKIKKIKRFVNELEKITIGYGCFDETDSNLIKSLVFDLNKLNKNGKITNSKIIIFTEELKKDALKAKKQNLQ